MSDLDYFSEINENKNIWIGFSKKNNWVILDRNYRANSHASSGVLYFVKIDGWTVFEENGENWSDPEYLYIFQYFEDLSLKDKKEIIHNLKNNIEEYLKSKSKELEYKFLELIHNNFLNSKGYKNSKIQKTSVKFRRISHCWNCKDTVDNVHDFECSNCRWIICGNCGACKLNGCLN